MNCPCCHEAHCPKCGRRFVGGLCHGPPCNCGSEEAKKEAEALKNPIKWAELHKNDGK